MNKFFKSGVQVFVFALTISVIMMFSSQYVFAKIGVGVGTTKIKLEELLRPGKEYTLPGIMILNTGDEAGFYGMSIEYHEKQPELKPPREWFTFTPNGFDIKPQDAKEVIITVKIPEDAQPGDYFAYLEAMPQKKGVAGEARIAIAAAAKLNFTVGEKIVEAPVALASISSGKQNFLFVVGGALITAILAVASILFFWKIHQKHVDFPEHQTPHKISI
jgi:hypothetical protein